MPPSFIRRFIKKSSLLITIIVCLLFLLSSLIPFLNPQHFWFVGFFGLMVPYIIILLVFAIIFWLVTYPRYALIPAISLIIGYKQVNVAFAFNLPASEPVKANNDSSLRIVSWNVGNMYGLSNDAEKKQHDRNEIPDAIIGVHPDIICLQEFNHSYTKGGDADNIGLFTKEFPHYYYAIDYSKSNGSYTTGSIIFSKFPIINSGKKRYPGNSAESLIYTDVVVNEDTLRIFTTHLQSFAFTSSDYASMDKMKERNSKVVQTSKNIAQKMKVAFTTRGLQADVVKSNLEISPFPKLICGDFNDVPNSYTYFHIKGDMQDAFLQHGFGVGKTFIALAPTLRIDYILPDSNFTIHYFDMVDESLSDHLMLLADISIKN